MSKPDINKINAMHEEAMATCDRAEALAREACSLFAEAATKEAEALSLVPADAQRTRSVLAISVAACYLHARRWDKVRETVAAHVDAVEAWAKGDLLEIDEAAAAKRQSTER